MEKNHRQERVSTNTAFLYEKRLVREMVAVVSTAATHGLPVKTFLEEAAAVAWLFENDKYLRRRRGQAR